MTYVYCIRGLDDGHVGNCSNAIALWCSAEYVSMSGLWQFFYLSMHAFYYCSTGWSAKARGHEPGQQHPHTRPDAQGKFRHHRAVQGKIIWWRRDQWPHRWARASFSFFCAIAILFCRLSRRPSALLPVVVVWTIKGWLAVANLILLAPFPPS